jgi:exopolysaccharide/PEP-CTERM locus tyrosine autokinase
MSLVEQALKKMQEASRPGASNGPAAGRASQAEPTVPGRSSETATYRALSTPPATPARKVAINPTALRAAGLMPPEDRERHLSREYRQIKRPLVANAIGRGDAPRLPNGHLIMLASAMPGEGKTFTAINLALSMSIEKDVHVLLVDADVAKPHISRLLGVSDVPGLLDTLRDPSLDVESVILPTDVANLSLLPAGTRSEQATELLASARMEQVIRTIGRNDDQRIVIFDSPPLLLTTESHALTHVVGQIVVVVRAGQTSQQTLLDALSYVGEHPSVSLILNQSVTSTPSGYYYYGYGDKNPSEPTAS